MIKNAIESTDTAAHPDAHNGQIGQPRPPSGETVEFLWDLFDTQRAEFADAFLGRWWDIVDVEQWCRENLRSSSINFVSAPWTRWVQLHRFELFDRFPVIRDIRARLEAVDIASASKRCSGRDNITALQLEVIPTPLIRLMKKCGIRRLFMVGGAAYEREKLRAHGIEPIAMPYLTPRPPPAPQAKDILFSFIGGTSERNTQIRPLIRQRFAGNPHVTLYVDHHWQTTLKRSAEGDAREARYDEVIARTRFALCPSGSSPQTVRFYEALSVGAIPVVIAKDWAGPEWDWDRTCLFLSPAEFEAVTRTPGQFEAYLGTFACAEDEMRANCRNAWESFNRGALSTYVERVASAAPILTASNPWGPLELESIAEACEWDRGFRDWQKFDAAAPTVIPLPSDRAVNLFDTLSRTKSVPAACTAAGVGRGQWDALLATFPDFRRRAVEIVGADGVRARW